MWLGQVAGLTHCPENVLPTDVEVVNFYMKKGDPHIHEGKHSFSKRNSMLI